jgi:hypothetical protein
MAGGHSEFRAPFPRLLYLGWSQERACTHEELGKSVSDCADGIQSGLCPEGDLHQREPAFSQGFSQTDRVVRIVDLDDGNNPQSTEAVEDGCVHEPATE